VIVRRKLFRKAVEGRFLRKRIIWLILCPYVISEATGCFISVCNHRNPGEYPVRLPRAAGFLQSRAAPVHYSGSRTALGGESSPVVIAAVQRTYQLLDTSFWTPGWHRLGSACRVHRPHSEATACYAACRTPLFPLAALAPWELGVGIGCQPAIRRALDTAT
jgi:hypothetical protein